MSNFILQLFAAACADHAGEGVMISDRDRAITHLSGGVYQLIRMTRTTQKCEIAGDIQLGIVKIAVRHTCWRRQRLADFGSGDYRVPNLGNPSYVSLKLAMHVPLAAFKHTEDPEALPSRFVFDVKVVASLVMSAPPLTRDALGADGVG